MSDTHESIQSIVVNNALVFSDFYGTTMTVNENSGTTGNTTYSTTVPDVDKRTIPEYVLVFTSDAVHLSSSGQQPVVAADTSAFTYYSGATSVTDPVHAAMWWKNHRVVGVSRYTVDYDEKSQSYVTDQLAYVDDGYHPVLNTGEKPIHAGRWVMAKLPAPGKKPGFLEIEEVNASSVV